MDDATSTPGRLGCRESSIAGDICAASRCRFCGQTGVVVPRFARRGYGGRAPLEKVIIDGGERMKKRFSEQQLYELRNFISIDWLIDKQLMIPCKFSEGFFRFLCPLCGEFQTATHPKTNLARCFRCEKNFNTIDLVMICNRASFVESIHFLEACRNQLDGPQQTFSQKARV